MENNPTNPIIQKWLDHIEPQHRKKSTLAPFTHIVTGMLTCLRRIGAAMPTHEARTTSDNDGAVVGVSARRSSRDGKKSGQLRFVSSLRELEPTSRLQFALNAARKVSLILASIAFLLTGANAVTASTKGQISVIEEIPVSEDVVPQWCYEKEPAFILVEGNSLYQVNLLGQKKLLKVISRPVDLSTLQCSLDGKTISFLNVQHDSAYIIESGELSEYALQNDFKDIQVRYGSLMSPDGSTFALEIKGLVLGPDILKQKVVLNFNTGDVFWTEKYIIYGMKNSEFAFEDLSTAVSAAPHPKTIANFKTETLVDKIANCGNDFYVTVFSDSSDRRSAETFSVKLPNSRKRIVTKK